jgi:hypothetical protein
VIEICPRCAKEEVTDNATGWGTNCASEHVVEQYMAREGEAADERREKWKQRSASDAPEALRERQRRHRLYAALQPKERPGPFADPWQIAHEGLNHLVKIRASAVKAANGEQHIEAVQECIRQLAVGPED